MDRFSQTAYTNFMAQVNLRGGAGNDKSKKGFILKRLVSRNRNRYQDNKFNLDLSYITNRVIAMGLPGKGFYKLFRNSQNDVMEFFDTYHDSRIKIYNMCNDDFVNTKVL